MQSTPQPHYPTSRPPAGRPDDTSAAIVPTPLSADAPPIAGADAGSPQAQSAGRRQRGWRRTLRHIGFLLGMLLLASGTVAVLAQAGMLRGKTSGAAPSAFADARAAQCTHPTPPELQPAVTARARVAREPVCVLQVGDPSSSLMQPVVDADGNLWFGEMRNDRLVRYDPRTGQVRKWVLPNGRHGLMMVRLDARGNIWFSEDEAGFFGRFDPRTEHFTTYPLPSVSGHSAQPEDIQFAAEGGVWFAAVQGGYIGRLDPASGAIRTWPVTMTRPDGRIARPYSLALAGDGSVWFGMALYGGSVGHLDPTSGHVTFYPLADSSANIVAMATDRAGVIWFADLDNNRLGRIDPHSNTVKELPIPEPLGDTSGLAALTVAPDGAIWLGSIRANALVRYQPRTDTFVFYPLTVAGSVPTGLAITPEGTVWFASNGERPGTREHEPADYIGWLTPTVTDN